MALDADGNLYGTAIGGGGDGGLVAGIVFRLDPSGKETILHQFGLQAGDGEGPAGGVAFDGAGNLFGTTSGGGLFNAGTVFKLSRDGQEQVLYSFTGGADGGYPDSGVVLDAAGNLYGATSFGGASGQGVVYQIQEGVEKVLLSFDGVNGSEPNSITRDAQGNIYGTTFSGGTYGYGVVFRISAAGAAMTLHNFSGGSDGLRRKRLPCSVNEGYSEPRPAAGSTEAGWFLKYSRPVNHNLARLLYNLNQDGGCGRAVACIAGVTGGDFMFARRQSGLREYGLSATEGLSPDHR